MTVALALVIALVSAMLVLEPLLRAASGRAVVAPQTIFPDSDDEDDPRSIRRDRALAALKEIEFDRATGKLSEDDYERMKTQFTAEALAALREADAIAGPAASLPSARPPVRPSAPTDAAIEQLIAAARAARAAGAAGAAKQRFCLECGAPLEGKGKFCLECGTPVSARV